MAEDEQQQHEGSAPLLEPAVLVVTNCDGCRGTGYVVSVPPDGKPDWAGPRAKHDPYRYAAPWEERDPLVPDVPNRTVPHEDCDGSGRVVREVPLSEFVQMAGAQTFRYQAPSPSEVRRGG